MKNPYSSEFSACTMNRAQGVGLEKGFLVESLEVMKFQSPFIVNLAVEGCMTSHTFTVQKFVVKNTVKE